MTEPRNTPRPGVAPQPAPQTEKPALAPSGGGQLGESLSVKKMQMSSVPPSNTTALSASASSSQPVTSTPSSTKHAHAGERSAPGSAAKSVKIASDPVLPASALKNRVSTAPKPESLTVVQTSSSAMQAETATVDLPTSATSLPAATIIKKPSVNTMQAPSKTSLPLALASQSTLAASGTTLTTSTSQLSTDNDMTVASASSMSVLSRRGRLHSAHSVDLTEEMVSQYLKTHTDFLLRWLIENVTREIVEAFAKKLKMLNSEPEDRLDQQRRSITAGGKEGEGYNATGSYALSLRHSHTSQIFHRYLNGERSRKSTVRKDRKSLQHMREEDLLMELIRDIASELDVNLLCHKILQNVSILTNSDRGSLFLVRGTKDSKYLVSKLFDVTETSTLSESIHTERNEIKVPFGKGIVGLVAQRGEPINIKDAYEDPRFNQEIDQQTGFRTHSILSMPIVSNEGEVIGVAQIMNKISGNHEFTPQDEELFRKYLIFCGIGITNAQLFEMSVMEYKRNDMLLQMARGIFEEQTNLESLVRKIMQDARGLLKCQKCYVYLLEDSFERAGPMQDISRFTHAFLSRLSSYSRNPLVMSMQDPTSNQPETPKIMFPGVDYTQTKSPEEVVFTKAFDISAKDGTVTTPTAQALEASKTAYIAKFVVSTGQPVNVPDADADGRFGVGPCVDSNGNKIKNVLCMPIHNSQRHIIGVTQLINKLNGEPFNDNDVNIIEAFSIFTGLGIHNCQMYENACQLMAKQSVALEVLSFHATAQVEEANSLMTANIPSADKLRLYSFDFDDHPLDDDGTLKACMRMFMEAGIISSFKVPYEVMCRWLCTVKKNYRPVTYHNWRHAFNVCQTMFTILFTGELRPLFEGLEVFALLAACLCHDLDHRGTNNAFQVKVASPLAVLYSTSVLEHHHFDHCIMILNSEGNNIFQSLSHEEYRRAIRILEHAILSTDLALYFKKRGDFKKLVETGEKSFIDPEKRALLRAMMMTACDVAAITKPWRIQQEIAQLVTAEFFEQGDIERDQLGQQPIPMMDRNKKDELPKMQVGFIDAICSPIYKLFAVMSEKLSPLYEGCEFNREKWNVLVQEREPLQQPVPESGGGAAASQAKAPGQTEPEPGRVHEQAGSAPSHPRHEAPAGNHPQPSPTPPQQSGPGNHQSQGDAPNHQERVGDAASKSQECQTEVEAPSSSSSCSPLPSDVIRTPSPTSAASPAPQPSHSATSSDLKPDSLAKRPLIEQPSVSSDLKPDPASRYAPPAVSSPAASTSDVSILTPGSGNRAGQSPVEQVQDQASLSPHKALAPLTSVPVINHHRNGNTAYAQERGSGERVKEAASDGSQVRGKRKTHAQAQAAAGGDKNTKKSGVCLVS